MKYTMMLVMAILLTSLVNFSDQQRGPPRLRSYYSPYDFFLNYYSDPYLNLNKRFYQEALAENAFQASVNK